jgi:hypothetical protein
MKPKPTSCSISLEGGFSRVRFNLEDLRPYLRDTKDVVLWVEDADGNQAPVSVESLREAIA